MFKKIILSVSILFLLSSATFAGNWVDFYQALRTAQKEEKLIILDFYTDWCGWCSRLKAEVFETSEFNKFAGDRFILTKVNAEKYVNLRKRYNVAGFPTVLILNKYGQELDRVVGYAPYDKYTKMIEEAAYSLENFYNLKQVVGTLERENRHINRMLGEKYMQRNDYKMAEFHLRKAIEIDYRYTKAYIQLGHLFMRKGDVVEAGKFYEQALKIEPDNFDIIFEAGYTAFTVRKYENAIEAFNAYINGKGNKEAEKINFSHYYRTVCAINLKNYELALIYLTEYRKLPGNEENVEKIETHLKRMGVL